MEYISVDEETKIEDIANNLYRRIQEETEKILHAYIISIGLNHNDINELMESGDLKKTLYPDDPTTLATYKYKDREILTVKIKNKMGIEFIIPKPKGEIKDV